MNLNKLRGAFKYGMSHHSEGRMFYVLNRETQDIGFLHVFRPNAGNLEYLIGWEHPQQISIYGIPYAWFSMTYNQYLNTFVRGYHSDPLWVTGDWYLGRDITYGPESGS